MLKLIAPAGVALAFGLAACDQTDRAAAPDADRGVSAEIDAGEPGGLGQTPPVNLAQDLAAGPAGLANAVIDGGDTDAFLRNAALGGMYEIQAGRIALDKAGSPELRALGQMLIDDHTRLNAALEQAAVDAGVDFAPPAALDERRQGLIDNLTAASDTTFDAAFLHQQEAAHLETLTLLESYEARGDAPALVDAARAAQETVRHHIEMIHDNLGAAVDGQ